MFQRYKELKIKIKDIGEKLIDLDINIKELRNQIDIYKIDIKDKQDNIRIQLEQQSERLFTNTLNDNLDEIVELKMDLNNYENNIIKTFENLINKCNNKNYIDFYNFNELLNTLELIDDKLIKILNKSQCNEYLDYFKNTDLILLKNKLSNEDILKYLNYYTNYDLTKEANNYFLTLVNLLSKIEDNSILIAILFLFFFLVYIFKFYIIVPYIFIYFCTLIIDVKKFILIIRLCNLKNIIEIQKNTLNIYNEKKSKEIIKLQINQLKNKKELYIENVKKLRKLIDRREDEIRYETKKNFNYEKAQKEAENNIKLLEKDINEKIEMIQETLKYKEKEYEKLNEAKNTLIEEFNKLKKNIKSSYEELKPNFNSYSMLKEFFLGFTEDEDISTFVYTREPYLIVYNDTIGQFEAMLQMISMILCQIICNMTPLAYHINIIDTLTAGMGLMGFTASYKDDEQNNLVSLIINDKSYEDLINNLYNEFMNRGVEIKTSFNDIEEYNNKQLSIEARSLPYIINIFFNYNLTTVINNDKLKQLNKVGSEIGIDNIYVFNISEIESNKKNRETVSTSKIYKYKYEDYSEFIKIFKKENIFSFNINNDDIKIVPLTKDEMENIIIKNI